MNNFTLRDAKVSMDNMMTPADIQDGYYQCVEFSVEQLPEIATWQVGTEYTLIIKVREKNHELEKTMDNKVSEDAEFEVLEVGAYADYATQNLDKVKAKLK